MNTLFNRRLSHSLILFAALAAGQLQAHDNLQLAENGSDRLQEQIRTQRAAAALKLAENGSERSSERQRHLRLKQQLQLAEGGAERSQALRRG